MREGSLAIGNFASLSSDEAFFYLVWKQFVMEGTEITSPPLT